MEENQQVHRLRSLVPLVEKRLLILTLKHGLTMTTLDINKLIDSTLIGKSRWELDTIIWNDRASNPKTLFDFLKRIKYLRDLQDHSLMQKQELSILEELAEELDQSECETLLSADDDIAKHLFIENLARHSALQTLCNNQLSMETMTSMCKLSPEDFILTARRSQDLINAIRELVIQGETLSEDVAGA